MSLIGDFNQDTGLDKRQDSNYNMSYPTGVDPFDMASLDIGIDDAGNEYYKAGLVGGKITMFIGYTDTGKSSAGIRIVTGASYFARIMNKWDSPTLFMDCEGLVELPRCFNLSPYTIWKDFSEGFSRISNRVDLTTERIYKYMSRLARVKKSKKAYTVKHPHMKNGTMVIPTFVLLDASSSLSTEGIMEDTEADAKSKAQVTDEKSVEMGNPTEWLTLSRETKKMVGRVLPSIEVANIPFCVVSHVKLKKDIKFSDKFMAKFLPGMKKDETLDNGKAFSDRAYHIYMLDAGRFDKDQEFGPMATGFFKTLFTTKSKSCGNVSIPVYYDIYNGIQSQVSNFLMLNKMSMLTDKGSGRYGIDGYDGSFTKKTLIDKYWSDETFADAYDRASYQAYLDFLYPALGHDVDKVIEYFKKTRPRTNTMKVMTPEERKKSDEAFKRSLTAKKKKK